jgi:ketosteroid isomerase-like protein
MTPDAGAKDVKTGETPKIDTQAPPTVDAGPVGEGGAKEDLEPVQMLVQAQRVALANADIKALAQTLSTTAIGFGVDADELAEGRDALAAQLERDLGELPANGFTVEAKFSAIGERDNHAWIALELEVSAPGAAPRRFAITELAAVIDNQWQVVAWHWAIPVADATAERLAILGTLPKPKPVPNIANAPKDIEAAVKDAFASREAFAAARSENPDGFNFGSAPNERIVGGARVKKVFAGIKAGIKLHDGLRVVSGDVWDPAQKGAPTVAYALANVDFTTKTRAATELTQTFRVLAVLIKEDAGWKIVQTQWSHGGPIR